MAPFPRLRPNPQREMQPYEYMSYPDNVWELGQSHYGPWIGELAAETFGKKPWWRFWA